MVDEEKSQLLKDYQQKTFIAGNISFARIMLEILHSDNSDEDKIDSAIMICDKLIDKYGTEVE